ncbi:hypothetical protein Btru_059583 [Bulinus truncatus]|nr:hypothetical protein Btru_059583 [Bulinus truncatus]
MPPYFVSNTDIPTPAVNTDWWPTARAAPRSLKSRMLLASLTTLRHTFTSDSVKLHLKSDPDINTFTDSDKLIKQTMSNFDEKVIQFFRHADKDNSGSISFQELVGVFRQCGYNAPESDLKELFKFIDTNNDNTVSLEELKLVLSKQPPKQKRESDMRAAFREIDRDGSGTISAKELQDFLAKQGYTDDVKSVIAHADKNGDGYINFEEFLSLLQ